MIKLIDPHAQEIEVCELAKERWAKIKTTPHQIDAQTYIYVREGHDPEIRGQKFKVDLEKARKYDMQHADAYLSK